MSLLLALLLRWGHQPALRDKDLRAKIGRKQMCVAQLLHKKPDPQFDVAEIFARAYKRARLLAVDSTGLNESTFPIKAPFSLEEALGDFWPVRKIVLREDELRELGRVNDAVISEYWPDRDPAILHVSSASHEALITLNGKVFAGKLPDAVQSAVLGSIAERRAELYAVRRSADIDGRWFKVMQDTRLEQFAKSAHDAHLSHIRGKTLLDRAWIMWSLEYEPVFDERGHLVSEIDSHFLRTCAELDAKAQGCLTFFREHPYLFREWKHLPDLDSQPDSLIKFATESNKVDKIMDCARYLVVWCEERFGAPCYRPVALALSMLATAETGKYKEINETNIKKAVQRARSNTRQ